MSGSVSVFARCIRRERASFTSLYGDKNVSFTGTILLAQAQRCAQIDQLIKTIEIKGYRRMAEAITPEHANAE
jgi:hypothetical protein